MFKEALSDADYDADVFGWGGRRPRPVRASVPRTGERLNVGINAEGVTRNPSVWQDEVKDGGDGQLCGRCWCRHSSRRADVSFLGRVPLPLPSGACCFTVCFGAVKTPFLGKRVQKQPIFGGSVSQTAL